MSADTLAEPLRRLIACLADEGAPLPEAELPLLRWARVDDAAVVDDELALQQRSAGELWAELSAALRARAAESAARLESVTQRQRELEERAAAGASGEDEAAVADERRALAAEREALERERDRDQQAEWLEHVRRRHETAADPLLGAAAATGGGGAPVIAQQPLPHLLNAPPRPSAELLKRMYTPTCPRCATRYTQPPPQWDCPLCLRRTKESVKVWQPDEDSRVCMLCGTPIARFSRHHCRHCGRLTCSHCCGNRALIAGLGYQGPVKVCDDCAKTGKRTT